MLLKLTNYRDLRYQHWSWYFWRVMGNRVVGDRAARFYKDPRTFSTYPHEKSSWNHPPPPTSNQNVAVPWASRTLPRQNLQSDSSELEEWLGTHARAGSRLVGPLAAIGMIGSLWKNVSRVSAKVCRSSGYLGYLWLSWTWSLIYFDSWTILMPNQSKSCHDTMWVCTRMVFAVCFSGILSNYVHF